MRQAWHCVTMTLTAPGCPAAQSLPVRGRLEGQGCRRASPTRRSMSCGSLGGRRIGCRRPRSSSWGCGKTCTSALEAAAPCYGGRNNYAATLKKSRLRADGDEASRDAHRSGLGERARDCGAVRHPGRADGQGAAAAGAARAADVAPGHAWRIPSRQRGQRDFGRGHHPGDRRAAHGHGLLDRGGELRAVREVQRA